MVILGIMAYILGIGLVIMLQALEKILLLVEKLDLIILLVMKMLI